MRPKFKTQLFRLDDPQLRAVIGDCKFERGGMTAALEDPWLYPNALVVVGRDGRGRTAGWAMAYRDQYPRRTEVWAYVRPSLRRRGLGTQLARRALRRARKRGFPPAAWPGGREGQMFFARVFKTAPPREHERDEQLLIMSLGS